MKEATCLSRGGTFLRECFSTCARLRAAEEDEGMGKERSRRRRGGGGGRAGGGGGGEGVGRGEQSCALTPGLAEARGWSPQPCSRSVACSEGKHESSPLLWPPCPCRVNGQTYVTRMRSVHRPYAVSTLVSARSVLLCLSVCLSVRVH